MIRQWFSSHCGRFVVFAAILATVFVPPIAAAAADKPPSLGQRIVNFCVEHKGQQVGDGECYALAAAALEAAGAAPQSGTDPNPDDYVWGQLVLVASGTAEGLKL